ncbi:hypothetical protein CJ258_26540 (plasmid) [Klebsiella pneumoniae]|uniref:hypothetical protein n=1 Tax=Klebsiella pneumoniae TaxID=573 RepID=UPI000E71639E|nr:hypothetical protein [Klebsiella pneumoniae]AYD37341.1 hypothetical protein CJ258_26540 [Klebsiella pneumoniae]
MVYSDLVSTAAMIVALIAVPASGYLSYHYAIKGERRKEFNAVADAIRKKLRDQLDAVEAGYYPSGTNSISEGEFEYFLDLHPRQKRAHARDLWQEYQRVLIECLHYDEDNFLNLSTKKD